MHACMHACMYLKRYIYKPYNIKDPFRNTFIDYSLLCRWRKIKEYIITKCYLNYTATTTTTLFKLEIYIWMVAGRCVESVLCLQFLIRLKSRTSGICLPLVSSEIAKKNIQAFSYTICINPKAVQKYAWFAVSFK